MTRQLSHERQYSQNPSRAGASLTASYFTCWAFFDACAGAAEETIGTAILEVGAGFGMHKDLLRLIRLMQRSRMGVYLNEGIEGNLVVLRELVTDALCRAIVPAGYGGRKGEPGWAASGSRYARRPAAR